MDALALAPVLLLDSSLEDRDTCIDDNEFEIPESTPVKVEDDDDDDEVPGKSQLPCKLLAELLVDSLVGVRETCA